MKEKEYLKVFDIMCKYQQSSRNIRRIIKGLEEKTSGDLLYKDTNGEWNVHRLLLSNFKPKRRKKMRYFALTIDPINSYSREDIDGIMHYVCETLHENVEVNYVIEQKKSNGVNHLHCFVQCNHKRKFIESIKLAFSMVGYHESKIFDLENWKAYMRKEGEEIKCLSVMSLHNG